jgi:hypothetical protein
MSAPAWASWWARSCCSVVGQLCFLLPPVQIDDYRVGLLPCRGDALQQPVGVECRGHNAPFGQLVGDEAVAELRIVVVDVDRGVDQMRVVPVALADRGGLPRVERLLRSCRARGRSPRHGSCWRRALGPAGTSFWEHVAGEVRRRPAQDLVLLLQLLGSLTQLAVLGLQSPPAPRVPVAEVPRGRASSRSAIFNHRARQDSETPKLLATRAMDWSSWRATAITSRRNSRGAAWARC